MSDTSFGPFDWFPRFPRRVTPDLPLLGLSEDEKALIRDLQDHARRCRPGAELAQAYYLGEQVIRNLRIAVPKELEFLRTIVGWPAMAVDPYVERLHIDGFLVGSATDADQHLADIMAANGFDAEQSLAFTDALSMGRGYGMVGSPTETGGAPVVTVESPLNMTVLWDLSGTSPRAAMHEYWSEGRRHGAILVPNTTVTVAENDSGEWEIVDRDQHDFDFVPVVRMANRPRTHDRDGRSEISLALRSLTDAACRTLLGLEVARELYSVPQKVLLGATEADFQNADGSAKSAWDTYITRTLALERDDEGNIPEIKQMTPYDPSVFTRLLDWYASAAAGEVAATPQDMGLYTQGNPASAEAVQAGESRRDRRAERMQAQFGVPAVRLAQYAIRFENGGRLPREYERIAADWSPVTRPVPGVTSDAVTKEIAAGAVPATSDVTLKRLGYSAVQRRRLEQDRQVEQGLTTAQQIAEALNARQQPQEQPSGQPAPPAG